MLSEKDAVASELVRTPGRCRRIYTFSCKYPACSRTFKATKYEFGRRTGFCKTHTKVFSEKRQAVTKPFWSHYSTLKANAKKYHPDKLFDLSYEQFLFLTQIRLCYYCGDANIVWDPHSDFRGRSNLDRKNNELGYTFDNVAVCCKECNIMKRNWFTADEFKAIRLLLRRWRSAEQQERDEIMYMLSSLNQPPVLVDVLCL